MNTPELFQLNKIELLGNVKLTLQLNINNLSFVEGKPDLSSAIYCKFEEIKNLILENQVKNDPIEISRKVEEKYSLLGCFGDNKIFVEEIPNGYMSNSYYFKNFPWYQVTTNKGRIIVGWRKRVINIDWSGSIIKESAEELFPEEDVTKDGKLIHAWSYEKAKEYRCLYTKRHVNIL